MIRAFRYHVAPCRPSFFAAYFFSAMRIDPMNTEHFPTRPPLPLHAQIREEVRTRIRTGTYRQHQRIPSEKEFMEAFGVSRITVRQALGDLEKEGLVFKIAGKGCYVSKPKPTQELARLQGFGEAMSSQGFDTFNQVIGLRTLRAPEPVARSLGLGAQAQVTEIRRVRHLDRVPVSLDITYVAHTLGARLAREDLATRDIFLILENDYGIALGHADLSIDAVIADAETAACLHVAAGAPLLYLERLTHERDGAPVELDYVYYRGDNFRYRLRVERG
jgi:GntR family transcriptional regulator